MQITINIPEENYRLLSDVSLVANETIEKIINEVINVFVEDLKKETIKDLKIKRS